MDSEIMFICLCFLLHIFTTSSSVSQNEVLEFPKDIFIVDKYLTIPLKNIKVNTNNAIMHLKFEHQSAGYCDFVVTIGQQNCTCIDTCSKTDQFNCTINIDTGPLLLIPKVIHRDNCQVPSLKLNLVTTVNSKDPARRVDSFLDTDFALCTPGNADILSSKCLEKHGPSALTQYITTQEIPTSSETTDKGSQWSTSTIRTTSDNTSSQTTSEKIQRSTATTATDERIMPSQTLGKSTQKSTSTKRTTTHEDKTLQASSENTQSSTSTVDKDSTSSQTTDESIEVLASTSRFSNDSTSLQILGKTVSTSTTDNDIHLTPKKANHISWSQKRDKPNMALALGITISLCSAGVFIMVFLIARVMYKTRKFTSIGADLAQNEDREFYTSATNTAFNPCFVHIRKISESNTDDDSSESQTSSPETTERKSGRYWDRSDTSRDCCTGSCGDFSSLCSENNCVSIARPGRRGNIDVAKHRHDTKTAIYAVSYKKK